MSKTNKTQLNQVKRKKKKKTKTGKAKNKKNINSVKTSIKKNIPSCNWAMFVKQQNPEKVPFKILKQDDDFRPTRQLPKNQKVDKVVALDCEMVSNEADEDMLARVSVVNYKLQCIYDKYVKPESPVGDYRTRYSGIRESDLENAEDFKVVQREVRDLLRNKILVGHALFNDFKVLKFGHHTQLIRDTSKYLLFKETANGNSPSLKKLTKMFLDEDIQTGEHNSIEDAKAAMKLYIKHRHEWENSIIKPKSATVGKPV